MDLGVVREVLSAYGLVYDTILPPQKGYRNQSFGVGLQNGETVNLILYKSEPEILAKIKNANNVGDFLATAGLPARKTYSPQIIRLQSGQHIKYGALYNYLPGKTIPWEAYTREHIKNLGGAMGNIHAALAAHANTGLPNTAQEHLALLTRMQRYFSNPQVAGALKAKLAITTISTDFAATLRTCATLLGQQTLHMDFVRGNILFKGSAVTGILDFEKTSVGHPMFDIARTLAFLLVDCKFKQEDKIRKYFLQSGYNKRSTMRFTGDPALLEGLLSFFLLHDFYKFLRHNPYEHLPQNEHFVRTVQILRKRGIIS